jgi:hypothetical protein
MALDDCASLSTEVDPEAAMFIYVLLGVFLVMGTLAGLSKRRGKSIQSNPNFAPTDHVEADPSFPRSGRYTLPTETHHDGDPPGFQIGD